MKILNRFTGVQIFEFESISQREVILEAFNSGADLSSADLRGADLSRADLSRADLSRADLSSADLSRADLSRADLSSADLSRADLSSADLKKLVSERTILPDGDLIGWKKLGNGIICKLLIPAGAKRVG